MPEQLTISDSDLEHFWQQLPKDQKLMLRSFVCNVFFGVDMEENYILPSYIERALKDSGYPDPQEFLRHLVSNKILYDYDDRYLINPFLAQKIVKEIKREFAIEMSGLALIVIALMYFVVDKL